MTKQSIFYIGLVLILASCKIIGNDSDDDKTSEASVLKIYCMEDLMADALAWNIHFNGNDIKTEGRLFSLQSLPNNEPYEINLEKKPAEIRELPYGQYAGTREADAKEILISIDSLDKANTDSFGANWYDGSVVVDGNTFKISCWESKK